jgi:uncharacterized damage-inducible protein DinB
MTDTIAGCEQTIDWADGAALPPAVEPLIGVLRQLADLLDSLTDAQYVMKPVGVVPSSIGGHVRHNLDHVDALLNGLADGAIDYDARQRGTSVELDRRSALDAIRRLERQLLHRDWHLQPDALRLTTLLSPDAAAATVETSLDRELAFVLSHTIHHNALIGVMAKLLGVPLPDDFGYAPSTVAHQRAKACAR